MRIVTIKKGLEERNAYCRGCDWSSNVKSANITARHHTKKTGHAVDIYTENRTVTKFLSPPRE